MRQQKDICKNLFSLKNAKKRSNKDIYLKNNLELALKRLYETNASITLLDQQEAGINTLDPQQEPISTEPEADIPTNSLSDIHREDLLIQTALGLNFTVYPRPKRNGDGHIIINDRKQASRKERMMTLLLVKDWGWRDNNRTYVDKMRLSRAASRLIAYDTGFLCPFSYAEIMVWESDVKLHLDKGEFAVDVYLKTR